MRLWVQAATLAILVATPVISGADGPWVGVDTKPGAGRSDIVLASSANQTSLRPLARPTVQQSKLEPTMVAVANRRFAAWVGAFRDRASALGIKERTLDQALTGVIYDPEVIERDRNQSEFTKSIWDYLDSAVSEARIKNGKSALEHHRENLERIEARYGVEKEVVVAIWGLESAYGAFCGDTDIIGSLATLAFDGRRGKFFESQLIAALKILQAGDITPRKMTGSWAGAMGHTQFIPTSYLEYAVDFSGDGKRDIWSDDPSDALASTAAYLARFGWTTGQPWGVEVTLPDGFDFAQAQRSITKSPAQWARLGVMGVDEQQVEDHGMGSILLPAGGGGAAFLVFQNFEVLERYNTADAYVIGVGHLSDRIRGGEPIQAQWPRNDRALTMKEHKELQRRLTALGFDTMGVDGRIGPNTIAAVRGFQTDRGLLPDGYASLELLQKLR